MPSLDNILKQLKDHAVTPPAGISDAIRKTFAEEKTERAENLSLENITGLRDKAISPPAFLLDNIIAAGRKTPAAKVVPLRRYITAIAAALLIIGGITIAVKFAGKKEHTNIELAISPVINQQVSKGVIINDTAVTKTLTVDKMVAKANSNHASKKYGSRFKNEQHSMGTVDGDDFKLRDNDLLYSFTNFNYSNLPAFISSENTEAVKVRVDHSTSITISEGMVAMMKKMYKQRRNGKPTVKAKREKRKLQRWKNADTKFFDRNVEKNPMDPLDLSEFIF